MCNVEGVAGDNMARATDSAVLVIALEILNTVSDNFFLLRTHFFSFFLMTTMMMMNAVRLLPFEHQPRVSGGDLWAQRVQKSLSSGMLIQLLRTGQPVHVRITDLMDSGPRIYTIRFGEPSDYRSVRVSDDFPPNLLPIAASSIPLGERLRVPIWRVVHPGVLGDIGGEDAGYGLWAVPSSSSSSSSSSSVRLPSFYLPLVVTLADSAYRLR